MKSDNDDDNTPHIINWPHGHEC